MARGGPLPGLRPWTSRKSTARPRRCRPGPVVLDADRPAGEQLGRLIWRKRAPFSRMRAGAGPARSGCRSGRVGGPGEGAHGRPGRFVVDAARLGFARCSTGWRRLQLEMERGEGGGAGVAGELGGLGWPAVREMDKERPRRETAKEKIGDFGGRD